MTHAIVGVAVSPDQENSSLVSLKTLTYYILLHSEVCNNHELSYLIF